MEGKYKENLIAFARHLEQKWYVVVVPLGLALICKEQKTDIKNIDWKQTRILLPEEAPVKWENLLNSSKGLVEDDAIDVGKLFTSLPYALLKMEQQQTERNAGILMHITSLPSPFGIGDLGPEAKAFARFLYKNKQQFWQLLPLNPTGPEQSYSPYSSVSGMAGNPLLISPELLAKDGLLAVKDLKKYQLPKIAQVDFKGAKEAKDQLFEQAYQKFCSGGFDVLQKEFEIFSDAQSFWLHDFALYSVLKHQHEDKAWFEWPEQYKKRDKEALEQFSKENQTFCRKKNGCNSCFSGNGKL